MTTHTPALRPEFVQAAGDGPWWTRLRDGIARWLARRHEAARERAAPSVPVGGWYEHDAFLSSRRAVRRPSDAPRPEAGPHVVHRY